MLETTSHISDFTFIDYSYLKEMKGVVFFLFMFATSLAQDVSYEWGAFAFREVIHFLFCL
jgi:hypothetical protein